MIRILQCVNNMQRALRHLKSITFSCREKADRRR